MSNLKKNTEQTLTKTLPQTLATCTDKQQVFLTLAKTEQSISVKETLSSPALILKEDKVLVISQIVRALEFFLKVTGKEMEIFQIQILAGDLYEKFKTDTYEDVVLMLKKARLGEFGKVYRVDTFTIMEWANKYLDYKAEEREKEYLKQKNAHQKEVQELGKRFTDLPPELQEKFNKKFAAPEEPRRNIKDFLTREKHRDEIKKSMQND